jgi:tetratricopeptide (TPR) repeat protein
VQSPTEFARDLAPHQQAVLGQVRLISERNRMAGTLDARMLQLLGELCASAALHEDAVHYFQESLNLRGEDPALLRALGNSLLALLRPREAEAALRACLLQAPGLAEAHYQLGVALHWQARYDEALTCYERASALQSGHVKALFNQSWVRLLQGDFSRGWRLFQHRFHLDQVTGAKRVPSPRWLGRTELKGRRLLLYCEQGLGDAIQYLRYLPALRQPGVTVILQAPAPLLPLVAAQGWDLELVPAGDQPPPHDLHCPLGSLPFVFKGTIPSAAGYLRARSPGGRCEGGPLRVGLAWEGNAWFDLDAYRSIRPRILEPLLDLQGIEWVSLQRDLTDEDLRWLAAHPKVNSAGGGLQDFEDSAELISGLDLVISVDSAPAHLSGALARPTWVLLPEVCDWRWQLGRSDSPWYSSVRLFRQEHLGDWAPVIQALKARLELWLLERSATGFPCRPACGACCIAPSISSPIPPPPEGYPAGYTPLPGGGKPAGVPCPQLDEQLRCRLFGRKERPQVCSSLRPCLEMCGASQAEALAHLQGLEQSTRP